MGVGETRCWTEVTRGYLGEEEEALGSGEEEMQVRMCRRRSHMPHVSISRAQ